MFMTKIVSIFISILMTLGFISKPINLDRSGDSLIVSHGQYYYDPEESVPTNFIVRIDSFVGIVTPINNWFRNTFWYDINKKCFIAKPDNWKSVPDLSSLPKQPIPNKYAVIMACKEAPSIELNHNYYYKCTLTSYIVKDNQLIVYLKKGTKLLDAEDNKLDYIDFYLIRLDLNVTEIVLEYI